MTTGRINQVTPWGRLGRGPAGARSPPGTSDHAGSGGVLRLARDGAQGPRGSVRPAPRWRPTGGTSPLRPATLTDNQPSAPRRRRGGHPEVGLEGRLRGGTTADGAGSVEGPGNSPGRAVAAVPKVGLADGPRRDRAGRTSRAGINGAPMACGHVPTGSRRLLPHGAGRDRPLRGCWPRGTSVLLRSCSSPGETPATAGCSLGGWPAVDRVPRRCGPWDSAQRHGLKPPPREGGEGGPPQAGTAPRLGRCVPARGHVLASLEYPAGSVPRATGEQTRSHATGAKKMLRPVEGRWSPVCTGRPRPLQYRRSRGAWQREGTSRPCRLGAMPLCFHLVSPRVPLCQRVRVGWGG